MNGPKAKYKSPGGTSGCSMLERFITLGASRAGCPVVEINKRQINELAKTNDGALCNG